MLAGGLAIMDGALAELDVPRINPVGGAMRLGVLYDLLGRTIRRDSRARRPSSASSSAIASIARTRCASRRWRSALYLRGAREPRPASAQLLEWAGLLHELGYTVSHIGFHKHGAYILENADMPGFSAQEQQRLALLVLGCRGGLRSGAARRQTTTRGRKLLALRLAVLVPSRARPDRRAAHRARGGQDDPRRRLGALAQGASADRAPARSRA